MDLINFDFELKKMKKRRILILKELIFELYAFERNKYQLAKLVSITPQAIGPVVDLLEEVELITKVREVQTRKIPSFFYGFDVVNAVSDFNLSDIEKDILIELMKRFQPVYKELKELENEERIEKKFESFYEGIVPNNAKMFVLQVISSLLILAALILDIDFMESNPFFTPQFLASHPTFQSQMEMYKIKLHETLTPPSQDFIDFVSAYSKEIPAIYTKIWTELMQLVMFISLMKEPSVQLKSMSESKDKEAEMKKKLEKLVESFQDYSKKKLNQVIDEEGQQRNSIVKNLNVTQKKVTEIQGKVIEDKAFSSELENFYNKLNYGINKIKNLPLGIMGMNKEIEKVEFLNNKIAIAKAISSIISDVFDELQKLEKEIQFEGPNLNKIKKGIDEKLQGTELLLKWVESPTDFLTKGPSKTKINKKEIIKKLKKLIGEIKDMSVISEDELLREFKDYYKNLDMDLKVFKSVLNNLIKDKTIVGIDKIKDGKKSKTVYILRETSEDQQKIFELASHSPSGKVTIPKIIESLGWSNLKARYLLQELQANGQIEYSKSKSEGELWFIPGVMED